MTHLDDERRAANARLVEIYATLRKEQDASARELLITELGQVFVRLDDIRRRGERLTAGAKRALSKEGE